MSLIRILLARAGGEARVYTTIRVLDCYHLVVEAVGVNGVVEGLQKVRSVARHKVDARNLSFLQAFIRIKRTA